MIEEFRKLADNPDFRWGMIVGLVAAASAAVSLWFLLRRQLAIAAVAAVGGLIVVAVAISRHGGARHLLQDASFRWGVLGGVLVIGAAALCAWLVATKRRGLAGIVVGAAVVVLFVIGFRNGVDDLVHNEGFHRGLLGGAIVVALLGVCAVMLPRRPLGVAAAGVCAAGLWSFGLADRVPARYGWLVIACVLLGAAGVVMPSAAHAAPLRALLAAPGALALAVALHAAFPWSRALTASVVVVLACAAWSPERSRRWCAEPVLLAITFAGVYVCVPETALASVLFGAAVPFILLGWPLRLVANGNAMAAVFGLVVWVAFIEGDARPGSIVGAIACVGVFVLLPFVSDDRRQEDETAHLSAVITTIVHVLLVVWCSRVAGLENGAAAAFVLVVMGAAVAVVALRSAPTLVRAMRA